MDSYLIAGAAGFVGARVAELLLDEGATVIGVDSLGPGYSLGLREWRLKRLLRREGFIFRRHDLAELHSLADLVGDAPPPGALIYLAARDDLRGAAGGSVTMHEVLERPLSNLLAHCGAGGFRQVVLGSSQVVPGAPVGCRSCDPLAGEPYDLAQGWGERTTLMAHTTLGVGASAVRLGPIYGPASRPDSLALRCVASAYGGQPLEGGQGDEQRYGMLYIDDAARAVLAALRAPRSSIWSAPGAPCDMGELLSLTAALTRRGVRANGALWRSGGPGWRQASPPPPPLLGWHPHVSLRQGMESLVAWFRHNRGWARALLPEGHAEQVGAA